METCAAAQRASWAAAAWKKSNKKEEEVAERAGVVLGRGRGEAAATASCSAPLRSAMLCSGSD